MIGEDASQAFIYLWQNVRALRDSLSYLVPKSSRSFILASNSKAEVIQFEIRRLAELRPGRIGFKVSGLPLLLARRVVQLQCSQAAVEEETRIRGRGRRLQEATAGSATPGARAHRGGGLKTLESQALRRSLQRHPRGTASSSVKFTIPTRRAGPYRHPNGETLSLSSGGVRRAPVVASSWPSSRTAFDGDADAGRGAVLQERSGNDIAVQELLVAGRTRRPCTPTRRRTNTCHQPNYACVWGDFARYTGAQRHQ